MLLTEAQVIQKASLAVDQLKVVTMYLTADRQNTTYQASLDRYFPIQGKINLIVTFTVENREYLDGTYIIQNTTTEEEDRLATLYGELILEGLFPAPVEPTPEESEPEKGDE